MTPRRRGRMFSMRCLRHWTSVMSTEWSVNMPTSNHPAMLSPNLFTRRHALKSVACGFGYLALTGLTTERLVAGSANPLAPKTPHFKPRAKRVIFIFMQGGPSHIDTFDYKPLLAEQDGK